MNRVLKWLIVIAAVMLIVAALTACYSAAPHQPRVCYRTQSSRVAFVSPAGDTDSLEIRR